MAITKGESSSNLLVAGFGLDSICQGEVNLKQTFENALKRITGSRVFYVSVLLHVNAQ